MRNLTDLLTGVRRRPAVSVAPTPIQCPRCHTAVGGADLYAELRLCPGCRHHFSVPAWLRIRQVVDAGSFRELNRSIVSVDPLEFSDRMPYRKRIQEAQRKTGLADAVITGTGRIGGRRAVLAVMDFEFLGGSMGSVVGEKIALAFEHAVDRHLPVVVVATSGGARMQEGMLSLAQMAKTAAAAQRLHGARLPYIAVLADPCTGGVYASFANLADVILAEPGALIGFAGPRVVEQTLGIRLPPGSHTAEFQLQHGQVDRIVDRADLRDALAVLLRLLCAHPRFARQARRRPPARPQAETASAWRTVQLARHEARPTFLDYAGRILDSFVELKGDRLAGDDPAIVAGLAELEGQAVVVVGQERGHGGGRARPEGYRKAIRMMTLAAKLQLPLLTFVDTPGAYPGPESEERGLAGALAHCLARLSSLPAPVIAAVVGEGGSGGALALAVADRVLMQEHAIYSVIAPEGAAAILYRDASRAPEVTPALKLTAQDCLTLRVVDAIVPEPDGGAHADPDAAAAILKQALLEHLGQIQGRSASRLVAERYQKYRSLGETGALLREAIGRELVQFQETVARVAHLRREPAGG
ncbi:MAG: acetyl-CoA carboxylase, carboxyltransferase subunit beta [Chloroflexi bacterium]|nr:acetyl-CoA carboxylase, carboxyltransferase subunit beta [Chloroflexota bacterium]